MGNCCRDIKDEIAYFYTVVKNMDIKDSVRQSKINEHEVSMNNSSLYVTLSDNQDFDRQLEDISLLGWIELIEDLGLYEAIKSLQIKEQIFISYIVKECRTQQELSKIYKINQSCICDRFNKILRVIKHKLLSK